VVEDLQVLVELTDERLAVLQVAGQLRLALHRLAALHPRHVLDREGRVGGAMSSDGLVVGAPRATESADKRAANGNVTGSNQTGINGELLMKGRVEEVKRVNAEG